MRIAALSAIGTLLLAFQAHALDADLYTRALERYTVDVDDIASTRVDYAALRTSQEWGALVRSLREADPRRLESRDETLAFWINAYNILAIDLVRRHYPVDGIRSIGGFLSPVWKKEAGEIGGRAYTLHEIEHEILRPMGEPRIHGAIVCASLSCPPLRREPYRAEDLDAQLDDNMRRWLADPRKGARVDRSARTLHLSPIFDWFAEDFGEDVLPFVAAYLPQEDARWIRQQGRALRIRYLRYEWSLNDLGEGRRSRSGQLRGRSLGQARVDPDLAGERAVDGAAVGDLEQTLALELAQVARQLESPVDAVDPGWLRLTAFAVGGVDLLVAQPHGHALERKLLAARIEPQGHAGTGAERGE
jgi:hypothetical protein